MAPLCEDPHGPKKMRRVHSSMDAQVGFSSILAQSPQLIFCRFEGVWVRRRSARWASRSAFGRACLLFQKTMFSFAFVSLSFSLSLLAPAAPFAEDTSPSLDSLDDKALARMAFETVSCKDRCGGASSSRVCWCDEACATMGDCCFDYGLQCFGEARCAHVEDPNCGEDQYCQFQQNDACGVRGVGRCTDRPEECDKFADPVCGCDQRTYLNECRANQAGVSVLHRNHCVGPAPLGEACGGHKGRVCQDGLFCEYSIESECGTQDLRGSCQEMAQDCDEDSESVCGCDGKRYSSVCAAHAAGISVTQDNDCL